MELNEGSTVGKAYYRWRLHGREGGGRGHARRARAILPWLFCLTIGSDKVRKENNIKNEIYELASLKMVHSSGLLLALTAFVAGSNEYGRPQISLVQLIFFTVT